MTCLPCAPHTVRNIHSIVGGLVKFKLSTLFPFSRDTRLLFAASGLISISFFGIQMLLKVLYVLRLGYGPEYVGWFLAASSLGFMGMGIPSGVLGNRYGPRTVMLVGGAIVVVGMAMLPLSESMPLWGDPAWPIVSQVVLTVGWSLMTVNLVPALTAVTADQNRNSAFSMNAVLQGAGTFVGTLVGGLLPGLFANLLGESLDAPAPYRVSLWVGAVLALAAVIPLWFVRPIAPGTHSREAKERGHFPFGPIAIVIAYVYLRHAGWATCQAFFNAYLDTDLRLPTSSIGLISSAGQFLAILAPLLNPRLAARRSNGWTLIVTTLGVAASLVPLALVRHWAAAGLGRLVCVVASAVWLPALQAFQMERVDPRWRSLAYGAVAMGMGLGFSSTSLVGGYVISARGYRALFTMGIFVTLASAALLWGILRRAKDTLVPVPQPGERSRAGAPGG
jgi:MFS family permease